MSMLKWDREFALEQAADDAELLDELLNIFKDSFQTDLKLVEEGVAENSSEKVSSAAHSIKGAAASLGILGINEVALTIEEDARSGSIDNARKNLPVLHELLQELLQL